MDQQLAAHQHPLETSGVIFGSGLILGIVLDLILPQPIAVHFLRIWQIALGGIPFVIGVIFIVGTKLKLVKESQPSEPGYPTTKLITDGIFSLSRNPMYLGIVVLIFGLGFLLNNLWVLILMAPLILIAHNILIVPEETYLLELFGDDYAQYAQKTRRWI